MLARDRFLHSDNATLVVIGGVDRARLMRDLRQLLGPWPKGDRTYPSTFRQPSPPDGRVLIVDAKEARNAEVRIAVRGFSRSDGDALAASLLAQIARERWHTAVPDISGAFVRHEPYMLQGVFVFGASVQIPSAGKALAAAQDVMRALAQTGPTAAEVDRARTVLMTDMNENATSPDSLASAWLDSETYKSPNNTSSAELNRVTAADLQRVAIRLFKDTPQATIAVGDIVQLKAALGDKVEIRNDAKTAADSAVPTKKP
jgi:predicted Zn-dependent peptidase